MKPSFVLSKRHVWLSIGWFSGEEFSLFQLVIGRIPDYGIREHEIVLLDFQVAKFTISLGVRW